MKNYTEPTMELIVMASADVITLSLQSTVSETALDEFDFNDFFS